MNVAAGPSYNLTMSYIGPKVSDYYRTDITSSSSPRVQVPNDHIRTQNQYYDYYFPKPKYLVIGYNDPFFGPHVPN